MKRLLLLLGILTSSLNAQTAGSGLTIGNKTYATVIIDGREWMAENLATTEYISGAEYQVSPTLDHFIQNGWGAGSIIAPIGGIENGRGYLYNRNALYDAGETIAPAGWHVPTQIEWQSLIASTNQGTDLRKIDGLEVTEDYWTCLGNNNDFYNFSAIATGLIDIDNDSSTPNPTTTNTGYIASFWTSTQVDGTNNQSFYIARISCLNNATPQLNANFSKYKDSGMAVRLIKDAPLSNGSFNKTKISIYPNPVKTEFTINTTESIEEVEIFDMLGKSVYHKFNTDNKINIEFLTKGVYILKVIVRGENSTHKMIKE